jgi:plasmid stabilization system protein ParE
LTKVLDYIDAQSPRGATNVKRRIYAVIDLLADHPDSGRVMSRGDLRRFTVTPYPYVIFYRADATGIAVHGVRHAARRPL